MINDSDFSAYRAPVSHETLVFEPNPDGKTSLLRSPHGKTFEISGGIPNFVEDDVLGQDDWESLDWYRHNASTYDDFLPLTFRTLRVDETIERQKILAELRIEKGQRILETGCGTGRDSVGIAEALGTGDLFLQDISPEILDIAVQKFRRLKTDVSVRFAVANGFSLPFPNDFFDRTFHFGGLNTFGDKRQALVEMSRVTKPGGRVVVGDESIPSWLRATQFGKILMNSNAHFAHEVPLNSIPVEAHNFRLQWIMGDAFYLMAFDKRDGLPDGDFDFEIPGWRGGSHRKRLYGQLEGVSPELKMAVLSAAKSANISVTAWLETRLTKALKDEV